MPETSSGRSWVRWLYNHNPFYFISAMLMLFAVRASYGKLEIGLINCWVMMGVLAAYTLLLAIVGVLIIRWGKVWDDARSILLLLLLLFLAVSISADDLFVKMTSPKAGLLLLASGFLFSVLVTVGVFVGARIRWGWRYFVPYVLFLALFYATPWWCSPELHPRATRDLNWLIFLFPQVAALLGLTLLPAARRGASGVANNGTPWPWPLFPWMAFGVIGTAVAIRSFALAMTFSQTGNIWKDIKGRSGIVFDTIWGPYFLVPFAFVILLLVFESAVASGHVERASKMLKSAPLLLLMALPWSGGNAFEIFLHKFTASIASPLWLTSVMLLLFYGWGILRNVTGATGGLVGMISLLSVVQADTLNLGTLSAPQPGPLFLAGGLLLIAAGWKQSSAGCFAATLLLICAVWLTLPDALLIRRFRMTTCYHLTLLSCMACGLLFADRFSRILRAIGAAWLPLTGLLALETEAIGHVPAIWRLIYVVSLTVTCFGCAKLFRDRWYQHGSRVLSTVVAYGMTLACFREGANVIGRAAMTTFCWSAATLLIGVLISAHKANWLPKRFWPRGSVEHLPVLSMAGDVGESLSNQHPSDDESPTTYDV